MLKKQKIKILSIVGGTTAGLGLAVATPIAINLSQNQNEEKNQIATFAQADQNNNQNNSNKDTTKNKNYWIATGLAIGYGVIALIIAIVATVVICTNHKNKKEQALIQDRINENVINDELAIKTTDVYNDNANIKELDKLLEEENKEKGGDLRKLIKTYLATYVKVDHDNPVNVQQYYQSKKESYVPNVIYLKACPEHNFLYKNKNILCVNTKDEENKFDFDKKDVLIYDLWSNKITGYSRVVDTLTNKKDGLYNIIEEFSAFSEKDFDDLYENNDEACLLFCDNTVRFENPIDPETIGIKSLKVEEEENTNIDNVVVVYQQHIEPLTNSVDEIIVDEEPSNETIEVQEIVEEKPALINIEEYNNELAKETAKVEPVVLNDIEVVKPTLKDETKDIVKANEQTLVNVEENNKNVEDENDRKVIYQGFRIKTIIDKQTRQHAPVTFLVTKQETNNVSNSYELNDKKNSKNKNQKIVPEYTYKKRKITNLETEMLKKEGKYYKFKPSTHPKVREEQIKIMNDFCEDQQNNNENK